ncbi:unnamed protein product [Didymodactylos carnosus]|uniref:E3 ubiquitin-protein ligase n=1 Tax=Didymodactylos carnosus TaxID=1234261 RepID=A0A813PER8_9BILA|nr:unnamed protein product [Didymodactylos carnosus]CAF3534036.1 unnamed protein product [Didymodactylos carnosus]
MFKSQAGGACDCGDASVMHASGFCTHHGPGRPQMDHPPRELICCAEFLIPYTLKCLVKALRMAGFLDKQNEGPELLDLLNKLSDLGSAIQIYITNALVDEELYRNFTTDNESKKAYYYDYLKQIFDAIPNVYFADNLIDNGDVTEKMPFDIGIKTLLDELMFWCVYAQLPEDLVRFLLSLLPNLNFKMLFTKTFLRYYGMILLSLVSDSNSSDDIPSRLVHISVQLFSSHSITEYAMNSCHLISVVLSCIWNMFENKEQLLIPHPLACTVTFTHIRKNSDEEIGDVTGTAVVVDVDHTLIKRNLYWPLVSDFVNILSHKNITVTILENPKYFSLWLKFVSLFQGMNVNHRVFSHHVEYEPQSYLYAFTTELEICAAAMWCMINHIQTDVSVNLIVSTMKWLVKSVEDWLTAIDYSSTTHSYPGRLTFHLPLHRYMSVFAHNAIYNYNVHPSTFLPITNQAKLFDLLFYPLKAVSGYHEILANLWLRNGSQITVQAKTYSKSAFSPSMHDADLFFIQLLASYIEPNAFMSYLLSKFYVNDWLCYHQRQSAYLEDTQDVPMFESALITIVAILSFHPFIVIRNPKRTRSEVITILCANNRLYSEIEENIPDASPMGTNRKEIETILIDVADYVAPSVELLGSLQQGKYVLKGYIWETEYDPVCVLVRWSKRLYFNNALERYSTYIKQKGLFKTIHQLWPPFRFPEFDHPYLANLQNLLQSRVLHGCLFMSLDAYLKDKRVTENILYLTVYLIEMAVIQISELSSSSNEQNNVEMTSTNEKDEVDKEVICEETKCVQDSQYETYYDFDNILVNMSTIIIKVNQQEERLELDDRNEQLRSNIQKSSKPSRTVYTQTSTKITTVSEYVNESIISLLLKILYRMRLDTFFDIMKSILNNECKPSTSRIGDGQYFISQILARCIQSSEKCRSHVNNETNKLKTLYSNQKPSGTKADMTMEQKRARAKARQQKLLAEIAQSQMAYINEQTSDDQSRLHGISDQPQTSHHSDHLTTATTNPAGTVIDQYECCICRVSKEDNKTQMGLIGISYSSILPSIQYSHANEPNTTSVTMKVYYTNYIAKLLSLYRQPDIVSYGVNNRWLNSCLIHSCGHCIHLECLTSYLKSLHPSDEQCTKYLQAFKTVVAANTMDNLISPVSPLYIKTEYEVHSVDQKEAEISCALLRAQIEHDIIFYDNSSSSNQKNIRKSYYKHMHELMHISYPFCHQRLWTELTGLQCAITDNDAFHNEEKLMAILLRDPITMLYQLIMSIPTKILTEQYDTLVQVVYNVEYIKNLISILRRLSDQDKLDLSTTTHQTLKQDEISTNAYISECLTMLNDSDLSAESGNDMMDEGQSQSEKIARPIESIEAELTKNCTYYIKVASLIKYRLYSEEMPWKIGELIPIEQLVPLLADYLNLSRKPNGLPVPRWFCSEPLILLRTWLEEVNNCARHSASMTKACFITQPVFNPPRLIDLPQKYEDLYRLYSEYQCKVCSETTTQVLLCLICGGSFVKRYQPSCCDYQRNRAKQHDNDCGKPAALMLDIQSTIVHIYRPNRSGQWGSLYLDQHDEEDIDLKRGKTLYLNQKRVQVLRSLWLTSAFEYQVQVWIPYRSTT